MSTDTTASTTIDATSFPSKGPTRGRSVRSRWAAHLLSPALTMIPWSLTVLAMVKLLAWVIPRPGQAQVGLIATATALLLLSAALWVALTAWSSVGTLIAGATTLLLAWISSTSTGQSFFFELGLSTRSLDASESLRDVGRPAGLLLLGSLLIAMSLTAAVSRRVGKA